MSSFKSTVNSSLTALNARCTALENKDDEILERIYSLYYDSNADGIFAEDELIKTTIGNEKEVTYDLKGVGKYKIKLIKQK